MSERAEKLKTAYAEDREAFWGKATFNEAKKADEKITFDAFCDHKIKFWTEQKKAGPAKSKIYVPKAESAEDVAEMKASLERAKARADAMAARIKEFEDSQVKTSKGAAAAGARR